MDIYISRNSIHVCICIKYGYFIAKTGQTNFISVINRLRRLCLFITYFHLLIRATSNATAYAESNEVKVLRLAEKFTSLQVKVLVPADASLP